MHRFDLIIAAAGLAAALASPAAAVIRINEAAFVAGSGLITFSESALGTTNPTCAPATWGGRATSPTVAFGGFFTGQQPGTSNPAACPARW